MMTFCVGEYTVICHAPGLPDLLDDYMKRAAVADQFDPGSSDGTSAFLAAGKPGHTVS